MNINDFEKLQKDEAIVDSVAERTFYERGRARDPRFTAMWAEVPEEVKAESARLGFAIIYALVDDHTTEGCTCEYCSWQPESNKSRRIMCKQRWDRIPGALQAEISESVND